MSARQIAGRKSLDIFEENENLEAFLVPQQGLSALPADPKDLMVHGPQVGTSLALSKIVSGEFTVHSQMTGPAGGVK
jgi:hypothetical protein